MQAKAVMAYQGDWQCRLPWFRRRMTTMISNMGRIERNVGAALQTAHRAVQDATALLCDGTMPWWCNYFGALRRVSGRPGLSVVDAR